MCYSCSVEHDSDHPKPPDTSMTGQSWWMAAIRAGVGRNVGERTWRARKLHRCKQHAACPIPLLMILYIARIILSNINVVAIVIALPPCMFIRSSSLPDHTSVPRTPNCQAPHDAEHVCISLAH